MRNTVTDNTASPLPNLHVLKPLHQPFDKLRRPIQAMPAPGPQFAVRHIPLFPQIRKYRMILVIPGKADSHLPFNCYVLKI
jgi:hypothetical protein